MNYLQLPVEVLRRSAGMSLSQVAIWADAWTWAQNDRKAYRTNAQIAEMLNITERSASRAIRELANMGAIEVKMLNGRQRLIIAIHPDKWPTIDANVHGQKRPSTPTSMDTNVYPDPTQTSTQHRHKRLPSIDADVYQEDKRIDNRIDNRIEKSTAPKKESKPNDLQTVIDAFEEAGSSTQLAERFWNYYEANGWKVGRASMRDWKAAARNWITDRNNYNGTNARNETAPGFDPKKMAELIKRKHSNRYQ